MEKHRPQKRPRLRRHEALVLFVGYASILYWLIRLFVYVLVLVDGLQSN